MNDIHDPAGRVTRVTGAEHGVGRQIALHLGAHNAGAIAVKDCSLDPAEVVAGEVRAADGKTIAAQADVMDLDKIKAMVGKTAEQLEPIGVRALADMLDDPHLAETGFFKPREHPVEGTYREMQPPVKLGVAGDFSPRPAPHIDQDGDDIRHDLGLEKTT